MSERLPPGEEPDGLQPNGEEEELADGWYEIAVGVRELLGKEKVVEAVAAYLNSVTARNNEARNPIPYYVSLCFGLLIFAGIALLAWKKILDSQSTVILIGALIAAWWGQGQKQQPQK
jgi:hypothetical protein